MPGRFLFVLVGVASTTVACSAFFGARSEDASSAVGTSDLEVKSQPEGTHGSGAGTASGERLARSLRQDETAPKSAPTCPQDMASIDGRYCVDRWEASLVEILPNGGERAWSPFKSIEGHLVRAVSAAGVLPQAYISEEQAQEACGRSGKRLCSRTEWQHACMGSRATTYPYGDHVEKRRCNDHGRSPVIALYGHWWMRSGKTHRQRQANWDHMNSPQLNQLVGTLARTGAHEGCTNDYGVYDMVGNLHEWVDDPDGTFYGGFYQDTKQHGEGCNYVTTAHVASYHDYSTGFRCCADPTAGH